MKIKISLRGVVGVDETATSSHIQKALIEANGRDVELEIASPGGSVAEGIDISNMIRNYSGDVTAHITGYAASMASYIPLFANRITAEDNAVLMIHNPSLGAMGDHRAMKKTAARVESLTALLAVAYAKKTGKSIADIRAMMDEETFFYGKEIVDAGFADSIVETDSDKDRATLIDTATIAITSCSEQMQSKPEDENRLAAMLDISERANSGHGKHIPKEENDKMDPKLKAFLESRGLAKDATEDDAYAFMGKLDVPVVTPAAPQASTDKAEVMLMIQADRERCRAIDIVGVRAGMSQEAITAHKDKGSLIGDVRAEALDLMTAAAEKDTGDVPFSPSIVMVGSSSREKFIEVAEEAVMIRAGLADSTVDVGANGLAGYSMVEIARQALQMAGRKASGSAHAMLGQALTTSDLPIVLGNVLNKSVFKGFDTAEENWSRWCSQGEVSDFKQNSSVRLSEMGDLEEIPEGGEYKYDNLAEGKETFQLGTYGKIIRFSRQMLINDDLNIFSTIAVKRGETAARKIGDLAWNVLVANANMGDGVALFAAGHNNLSEGGAAAPSVTSIGAALAAMRLQKDLKGLRRLQIMPRFLLAPVTLETTLDKVLGRIIGTQAEPGIEVPQRMRSLEVITEARLDDDSLTAWYLAGAQGKTVEVNFLRGSGRRPMLEQEKVWNTDGAEFKTTLDVEAHALAYEGLQKNAGS